MTLSAIAFSFLSIEIDRAINEKTALEGWWVYTGSLDGARAILSGVAASMITVAGVVFSITIVVLSLASSQFGPRLIWNFMHDIGNQLVLGTFISTFMYCLVVLGSVGGNGESAFIPHLSVTIGIMLAMASLGVLIYFIHHVSASIHANSIVASVSRDLEDAIERLFPESIGHAVEGKNAPEERVMDVPVDFGSRARELPSFSSGYLEAISPDTLLDICVNEDLVLRLQYRPGHFVIKGSPLAYVWPGEKVDQSLVEKINRAFILGNQRTPEQDVEFSVNQLVEIAVRALSPGTNDPFTAITCIDWLASALCKLAGRRIPSMYRYDQDNELRIIAPQFTFTGVAEAAFNQIRQYGRSSVAVTIRLLEAISTISPHVHREEDRELLIRQARTILDSSKGAIGGRYDREDIESRYEETMKKLGVKEALRAAS